MIAQAFAGELVQKPHSRDFGYLVNPLKRCRKPRNPYENWSACSKSLATLVFGGHAIVI
jgi:hypothetical protein